MLKLPLYQVDAFADRLFAGNPAAVCVSQEALPAPQMQAIAAENNLAETAFLVPRNGHYDLRWFTPAVEMALCGHATLGSAYVLKAMHVPHDRDEAIHFETKSGRLTVTGDPAGLLAMDLPAMPAKPALAPDGLEHAMSKNPRQILKARDWVAIFDSAADIRDLRIDYPLLGRAIASDPAAGLIVTAPGDHGADFVSRYFAPNQGIAEDPATGSAHCTLTPLWSQRLKKSELLGHQLSQRGGVLHCRPNGDRVTISGHVVPYLAGTICLP